MDTSHTRRIDGWYSVFRKVEGYVSDEYARVGCSPFGIKRNEKKDEGTNTDENEELPLKEVKEENDVKSEVKTVKKKGKSEVITGKRIIIE